MQRVTIIGLAIVAALAVTACGGAASQAPSFTPSSAPSVAASPAASSEPAASGTFNIQGNKLPAVTAAAGETVVWKNLDGVAHTVTLDDGSVDQTVAPGSQFSHAFDTPGTYPYHCNIHSTMKGTITITQ